MGAIPSTVMGSVVNRIVTIREKQVKTGGLAEAITPMPTPGEQEIINRSFVNLRNLGV
jgi:hypothetical protein